MRFYILPALVLALISSATAAQNVQQSGPVTPRHVPAWLTTGIIGDGGTATDSPITSFGVTNNGGNGICVSSGRATESRNQLCLGAATNAPAFISLQNYGNAPAETLQFVVNGATSTPAFITGSVTANNLASFLGSGQVLQDSGIAASGGTVTGGVWGATPVAINFGGTGAVTTSTARSNLGLGTIALQNSSAVAITGGTITGLPTPTNPTDAAIKSYVDATASGLTVLAQSTLATAAVLPNTPTYANGASGIGATLTAASNTTLTVDGTAAPINTVVLVKNQASALQNGIYTVTTAGSGATPWVLTRAAYFDQGTTEMKAGAYTAISDGATNLNTSWVLGATVTTVGTDAVNFNLFSSTGANVSSLNGLIGALNLGTLTATATGGSTARSVNDLFGDFLTVKDFGATGTADDTATFQAAIDASCPGHLSGPVDQIFPILIPPGTYNVTQLNATHCEGFTMWGIGSGALTPALSKIAGASVNAVLDMTGSISGCNLKNFLVFASLSDGDTPYPNVGILLATSTSTLNTGNYCQVENVSVSGRFGSAAWYVYGLCCSMATMLGGTNAESSNPSATAVAILDTNTFGVTSSFVTIATGARGASNWACYRCEAHAFTGGSTQSTKALNLDGVRGFSWNDGIIASANQGFMVQLSGNNTQLLFQNTQFYTDQGPATQFAIGSVSGTTKNLVLLNPDATLAAGGGLTSISGFHSGRIINGIQNVAGVVSNFHAGDFGTAPTASSCGSSPTVTGSDSGGTVIEGGSSGACTITFATPYATPPSCVITQSGVATSFQVGMSATAINWLHNTLSNLKVTWNCAGP